MTYADGFNLRDKALCKINDIADAVDGLLVQYYQVASTGSHVTASTSYAEMTGMTQAVTVASGEVVQVTLEFLTTTLTVGDVIWWHILRDATEIRLMAVTCRTANEEEVTSISFFDAPGAGTYTYSAQIKNGTGARNVTTQLRLMGILKFQNVA